MPRSGASALTGYVSETTVSLALFALSNNNFPLPDIIYIDVKFTSGERAFEHVLLSRPGKYVCTEQPA